MRTMPDATAVLVSSAENALPAPSATTTATTILILQTSSKEQIILAPPRELPLDARTRLGAGLPVDGNAHCVLVAVRKPRRLPQCAVAAICPCQKPVQGQSNQLLQCIQRGKERSWAQPATASPPASPHGIAGHSNAACSGSLCAWLLRTCFLCPRITCRPGHASSAAQHKPGAVACPLGRDRRLAPQ